MSSKPFIPNGPTIPPSGNVSSLVVNKATVSDTALGFFGTIAKENNKIPMRLL